MRQTTREIRGAYIKLLSNLTYKGVKIPVKNNMINGKGAIIPLSNGVQFEAYINVINQFRNANEIKNGMVYNSTLTLDINTVFSGTSYNMAGSEWVEEITDLVYDALYIDEKFRLYEFGINNDRFVVTSNNNFIQPMPLQYTADSRAFRSVIVFEDGLHHTKVSPPVTNLWIKSI